MNNSDQTLYPSLKALSAAKNIPIKLLKAAKASNGPGFRANSSIHWGELEPWFNEHKAELEEEAKESYDTVRTENKRLDNEIKKLEIAKRKGDYLNPEEVRTFLKGIAVSQSGVLNSRLLQELPTKLAGQSVQTIETSLREVVIELTNIFKNGLDQWK